MEDEEEVATDTDEDEEEEPRPAGPADDDSGDASLEEILTKKPGEGGGGEDEDEESILSMGREDRIETLSVRVEPKKDTEFVCQRCYLVKPIRSQLADKKRMYCRDCA